MSFANNLVSYSQRVHSMSL